MADHRPYWDGHHEQVQVPGAVPTPPACSLSSSQSLILLAQVEGPLSISKRDRILSLAPSHVAGDPEGQIRGPASLGQAGSWSLCSL